MSQKPDTDYSAILRADYDRSPRSFKSLLIFTLKALFGTLAIAGGTLFAFILAMLVFRFVIHNL